MTKIDIFSGFLGAGKTTLIKKLLKEALAGSQVVLIENEFGEIGIDGGFLKESGIEIKEMNSGCICCSLVGDFGTSLKEVMDTYHPERILIEPSGVGKLSDVVKAVQNVDMGSEVTINSAVAVVDASKCRLYIKNFGEFFINQIEHAGTIILSRTDVASEAKIQQAVELIREHNSKATIITTPIEQLDGKDILKTIEGGEDLEKELMEAVLKEQESGHHHHHDGECCHGEHEHHDHEHCDHDHEGHDHEGHEHCDHDHEDHGHEGHDHEAMTTATITITAKAAAAAADMIMTTMITIMRTRCLPVGEPKRLHPTRGMRFPISWKRWRMRRNTASYSVQRAWCLQGTEPGYTLIMCQARAM